MIKAYIKRLVRKEVESHFKKNIQLAIKASGWQIDDAFRSYADGRLDEKINDLLAEIFSKLYAMEDTDPVVRGAFIRILIKEINKYQLKDKS